MITAIILQVILIFLNAVFASAEIAVISTNENKLEKLAEAGDKRAGRLIKLTSRPAKFLSTIQVAITLAGLLGSAFAADNFAAPLTDALIAAGIGIPRGTLNTICVIVITLILSYFSIVFGELIPKRIAMRRAEKMALGLSGLLKFVSVFFAPLVWLLTVSTNGVLRLFGIRPDEEESPATEEEIMLMVESSSEHGAINAKENELIQNVFEFNDTSVGEVCTHRKDTAILFTTDSEEEWRNTLNENYHTYYPVCGKDADDVIGILNTKIYFRLEDQSRENVLERAVEPAVFAAESMPADKLFYRMKSTREYFAIVVDEYGGMSGIVTIHDLIELLVGDLTDKGEVSEYEILPLSDREWKMTGRTPLDEVEKALKIKFPEEAKEENETLGGYACSLLGAVPDDGTTAEITTDLFKISVMSVKDHCIEEMVVTMPPEGTKD
jgi:hypothetical protein